ncbi:MAG: Ig-like domain repeat protein [Acidobacteriia bacterium]|nr:Ig-like domain repeat protein [Terriglobia bacterium]
MRNRRHAGSAAFLTFLAFTSLAAAQPSRISRAIDSSNRVVLAGHLHPRALAGVDQGRVAPSLEINYVTLELAQSDAQRTDLEQLLQNQQTPGSPDYHRWLSPEQFADRFGAGPADLAKITAWLQSQGLSIAGVARARNWIAVNGTAAQVETAFGVELHHYMVDGRRHFANATEPSVPAALNGVVRSIRGLNDFRFKSRPHTLKPNYTSSRGNHYLAPNDLALIYNIASLYSAGFDGAGQSIMVAGQSQINLDDLRQFRSRFNLPAADPQILLVPGSTDPGTVSGDDAESDLDLEWSGAVARNASIIFVYAHDVLSAVQYGIDQNLAPVLSLSYGSCEPENPASDVAVVRSWARQANAQGITWFAASGDAGGADCNDSQHPGLSVDVPGSVPEVTSVGGTEFAEGSGNFWNATTDANGASVISYIPEIVWNDSVADGNPAASGGGASIFFGKPSWQVAPGVPSDNARHVPDISMNASADHDGYLVYTGAALAVYGGTSVPTPVYAGIAAILNQYLLAKGQQSSAGLGNINPQLYALAQSSPSIFHDITSGDNIVTVACGRRSITCTNTPAGYSAGVGYDQATGLGSVDAYLLVAGWNGSLPSSRPGAVLTLLSNLRSVASTDTVYLTATVTASDGTTPAGTVTFSIGGVQLGSANLVGDGTTATATLAVKASQLPGSGSVTATYNGSTAVVALTVNSSGSTAGATPAIAAFTNAASYQQAFAPGGILTIWGTQLAPSTQLAGSIPLPISMLGVEVLINGIAAPLYYVSPSLVNVQIPYDAAAGSATLAINNNGQISTRTFTIAAAGPGIFTDATGTVVPFPSAARGAQIAIYITGAGAVSPVVSTGAAPAATTALANLPRPSQSVAVTVGGAVANLDFIGIPPGLVGVTQINFTIPNGVNPGAQPVIVKIGGVLSATATLNVTN